MSAGRFYYSFRIPGELLSLWHLLYNKTLIYWDLGKTACFVPPWPPFSPRATTSLQNTLFPSVSVNKW
jgi:hypothetical protein